MRWERQTRVRVRKSMMIISTQVRKELTIEQKRTVAPAQTAVVAVRAPFASEC